MGTAINVAKSIGEALLRHGAIKYGIGFWELKHIWRSKTTKTPYILFFVFICRWKITDRAEGS